MKKPVEFKWKHYQPDIILLTTRRHDLHQIQRGLGFF